jgi:hypothetical protein
MGWVLLHFSPRVEPYLLKHLRFGIDVSAVAQIREREDSMSDHLRWRHELCLNIIRR